MSHIRGTDRSEVLLFPEAIDDYITEDNPVRFVDAFVSSLDLAALGFLRATPAATGRPAYDPADLLKLYIYGYLNRVRSSRMLEREAERNVEVMWLMGKLTPDFKTIADFRKDNTAAIKAVCREFTLLCKGMDLFGGELVAIDGSKFRAVNSRKRNFNPAKLARIIESIDERIAAYLAEMEQQDAADPSVAKPSAEELRAKIEQLKGRRQFHQNLAEELEESGRQEVSLTDPDSRLMSVGGRGLDVCYNVQTAVDSKHKLIVHHEVTNAHTDEGHLVEMATTAKQVLGVETLEVVADKGYYSGEEIKKCEEQGIVTYIPKEQVSPKLKKELFTKDDFRYDPTNDVYVCPEGKHLTLSRHLDGKKEGPDAVLQDRRLSGVSGASTLHGEPPRAGHQTIGRRRGVRADGATAQAQSREDEAAESTGRASQTGTMKRGMNQGYFLLKGIKKVAADRSLTVLCYNLKRVVRIVGVEKMIRAVA